MYSEVAWVLVSSRTQVQPQIILEPDYVPDYLFVSYGYGESWTCYCRGRNCAETHVEVGLALELFEDCDGFSRGAEVLVGKTDSWIQRALPQLYSVKCFRHREEHEEQGTQKGPVI